MSRKRLFETMMVLLGLILVTVAANAADMQQLSMGSATAGGIFANVAGPLFMGAGEMAEALKDGAAKVSFLTEELVEMVAATHKIRLISWEAKPLKDFLAENPNYGEYVIAANTYKGVDYPVVTVDNGVQLICQADLDEQLAYELTKAVLEHIDCIARICAPAKAMSAQWAANKLGNPYHPGAIKYYQEIGVWDK